MKLLPAMLQEYFTTGKTPSQCTFLPWEGPIITVPDPNFDFKTLMHGHMKEDTLAALDAYDLFDSHSLLSLPPNTPANSHPSSPEPNKYPTPTIPQPDNCSPAQKSHGKWESCKNCKQKCQEMAKDLMHKLPPWLCSKHTYAAKAITTDFNVADVPHASSGYASLVKDIWKHKHLLAELVGPKTPTPVVNRERHVITILAGHPDDLNWETLYHEAVKTLERQRPECNLCEDQWKHQCGRFGALSVGILYGGRQMDLLLHDATLDLKLVIDFPPSSTILIPSAILKHSNMTIMRGERRYSFTQYSVGGLFHWVDYGHQTSEDYWASLELVEHAEAEENTVYVPEGGVKDLGWYQFLESKDPVLAAMALEMKNMVPKVLTCQRYYNRNSETLVNKAKERNRWCKDASGSLFTVHSS
ncbi:hypothetical protein ARMGADRAFT_1040562 [Armillaria gallica]|uniref:Uncharacterized protein n=1 Tax=Armillaria gallica TaxID=47427 RepID=A0A2H3CSP0_ARMGA|nr:hypothetical protein ARMGADRAFT_1040562 [Armillaria gallica]